MKTNKFAAGALALAMGLAAIAPAYAETTTTTTTTTETTGTTNAEFPSAWQYTEAGKAYVNAFKAWREAEKDLKDKEAKEAEAKAAYEAALKKLADWKAMYETPNGSYRLLIAKITNERDKAFDTYVKAGGEKTKADLYALTNNDVNTIGKYIDTTHTQAAQEVQAKAVKDIIAQNVRLAEASETEESIANKLANINAEIDRRKADYLEAINNRQLAESKLAAAKSALEAARKEAVKYGASRKVIAEAEKLGDITIITKTTTTTTEKPKTETETTTTTTETTKPGKVDKGISAETRAKLEAAIRDAEIKIESVKFLKENTPKTIAKVVDKLDKIVAEQEALIKSAKELLGQKAAFSLISTAYADEEKTAEEKAKELTDKLNENTAEIEKTLKENEANQGKEEKPADEKKPEEKPADNKKPADTKKPAKKAGKNAKTGIAGVAGVAGVLAAASVAYATSKKNK